MIFAVLVFLLGLAVPVPAAAAEPPERACLSQDQAREAVQTGRAASMAEAMARLRRRQPGTVVSVELCRKGEKLVYVFAIMAEGGRVRRMEIDALRPGAAGSRNQLGN